MNISSPLASRLLHGFFEIATSFEEGDLGRVDLDLLTGSRVDSGSRFSLAYAEGSKPYKLNRVALLERLRHGIEECIKRSFRRGFCHAGLLGHDVDQFALVQITPPGVFYNWDSFIAMAMSQ